MGRATLFLFALLADIFEIDSIYAFDWEGKTVAANAVFSDFDLSRQADDQSWKKISLLCPNKRHGWAARRRRRQKERCEG